MPLHHRVERGIVRAVRDACGRALVVGGWVRDRIMGRLSKDIDIEVNVGARGGGQATIYTCDLSAEYVKINAEYRT